jgi:hypothetical protein
MAAAERLWCAGVPSSGDGDGGREADKGDDQELA